jgi:hypothetical protein
MAVMEVIIKVEVLSFNEDCLTLKIVSIERSFIAFHHLMDRDLMLVCT